MMKKILRADIEFDTIYDITPELLTSRGIKFVLTDLDNTLADYDTPYPTESVIAWLASLKNSGIGVAIVSNNNMKRVRKYCEKLDLLHFWKSGKPRSIAVSRALKELGGDHASTALIGDKRLTDVLCAKLSGVLSIKVKSIKPRTIKWKK